jgi:hypothetical protein
MHDPLVWSREIARRGQERDLRDIREQDASVCWYQSELHFVDEVVLRVLPPWQIDDPRVRSSRDEAR